MHKGYYYTVRKCYFNVSFFLFKFVLHFIMVTVLVQDGSYPLISYQLVIPALRNNSLQNEFFHHLLILTSVIVVTKIF